MENLEFLSTEFFGNTVKNYIISISIIVFGLIFKGLISSYIRKFLFKIVGNSNNKEGKSEFDNLLKKPITYFLFLAIPQPSLYPRKYIHSRVTFSSENQ